MKIRVFAVLVPVAMLLAGCAGEPAKPVETAPAWSPATGQLYPKGAARLIAVGDTMLGTNFPDEEYINPDIVPGADLADIIGPELLALLRGGDIVFGNMEGSLFNGDNDSEHKPCSNPARCYVFRSPEFHGEILRDMGFNMMSMANNHSADFRAAGRDATIAALGRNRIVFAGSDSPGAQVGTLVLKNRLRVGFAAFAPNLGSVGIGDLELAARIVRVLAAGHDIVVVSFHGGGEGAKWTRVPREMEVFVGEERGDVYAFAHAVIDAGADVVLGHGPHVPRAVEVYKGRFIAYSLGNFWTYGRFNLRGVSGIAPLVDLELARDGALVAARIHSIRQEGWGVPMIDESGAALIAVAILTYQDFPETTLEFNEDGTITGFQTGAPAGAGVSRD